MDQVNTLFNNLLNIGMGVGVAVAAFFVMWGAFLAGAFERTGIRWPGQAVSGNHRHTLEAATRQLNFRCHELIQAMASFGVTTRRLGSGELAGLWNDFLRSELASAALVVHQQPVVTAKREEVGFLCLTSWRDSASMGTVTGRRAPTSSSPAVHAPSSTRSPRGPSRPACATPCSAARSGSSRRASTSACARPTRRRWTSSLAASKRR